MSKNNKQREVIKRKNSKTMKSHWECNIAVNNEKSLGLKTENREKSLGVQYNS